MHMKLPASWKTGLAAVGAAALGFIQLYQIHEWRMIFSDPKNFIAFVVAIGLALSKDYDVTGGNRPDTPEAADRVRYGADGPPK